MYYLMQFPGITFSIPHSEDDCVRAAESQKPVRQISVGISVEENTRTDERSNFGVWGRSIPFNPFFVLTYNGSRITLSIIVRSREIEEINKPRSQCTQYRVYSHPRL